MSSPPIFALHPISERNYLLAVSARYLPKIPWCKKLLPGVINSFPLEEGVLWRHWYILILVMKTMIACTKLFAMSLHLAWSWQKSSRGHVRKSMETQTQEAVTHPTHAPSTINMYTSVRDKRNHHESCARTLMT